MLSLCHTVSPLRSGDAYERSVSMQREEREAMEYTAASPDEKALVEACRWVRALDCVVLLYCTLVCMH